MLADESKLSIEGSIHSALGKDDLNCGDDASHFRHYRKGLDRGQSESSSIGSAGNGHVGSESSMNAKTMKMVVQRASHRLYGDERWPCSCKGPHRSSPGGWGL